MWAAPAFAARHPNVAVLDLSSFKCGHDAPTYGLIGDILQTSKTPAAALHDLDANKPGGLDQDSREDLRALAAPGARAARGTSRPRSASSRSRWTGSDSSCWSSQREQLASITQKDPGLEATDRRAPREDEELRGRVARGGRNRSRTRASSSSRRKLADVHDIVKIQDSSSASAAEMREKAMTQQVQVETKKKTLPIAGQTVDVDAELSAASKPRSGRASASPKRISGSRRWRTSPSPSRRRERSTLLDGGPHHGPRLPGVQRLPEPRLHGGAARLPGQRRSASARSLATAASATRPTSPSATW